MKSKVYYTFLKEELEAIQQPQTASKMKAYMKDHFDFLGVNSPRRKEVVKLAINSFGALEGQEIIGLLHLCWKNKYREVQYAGLDIAQRWQKNISTAHFKELEYFIINKSWWDTVDAIASNLFGLPLLRAREEAEKWSHRWVNHENMWMNRLSLIMQLKWKEKVLEDLLFQNVLQLSGTKEFFINKAAGWGLRSYAKVQADSVLNFVRTHEELLSNLTKREALKHLL